MSQEKFSRRNFISAGTALTVGSMLLGGRAAQARSSATSEFNSFSRYKPSFGGPPDNDHYMGKLMPGLRGSGLPPVPVHVPDVEKLPFKIVAGAKEFHLKPMAVKR